jgi:hypothetical protein
MKLGVILAGTVLLKALAPVDVRAASADEPTYGAVLVRLLPNNPGRDWLRFRSWDELIVQRVLSDPSSRSPRIHLRVRTDGTSQTDIYAATLAPGIYRLDEFASREICDVLGCRVPRMSVDKNFSHFEVAAGRITDLGVLIETEGPGGGEEVLGYGPGADPRETKEIVKETSPELATLGSDSATSWVSETIPTKMPELYEWTLTHAVGVIAPKPLDDGSFIYGTRLGTLVSWKPGKLGMAHDIGARSSIESVLATNNRYWIVGGELGLLRVSTDQGHSWHSVRGNLPFGVVVSLSQWHDKIVATTWMRSDVHVHSADIGASDWKELAHYQLEASRLVNASAQVIPRSVLVENSLLTALPDRKLGYLDLSSGREETRELPGSLHELSFSADATLRCLCIKTFGKTHYESHDLGKTWRDSGNAFSLSLPVFRNAQYGVAYKRTGPSTGVLAYTENGGARWTALEGVESEMLDAKPPESLASPIQLFYSLDGSVVFAAPPYGEFRMSRDDGKSWQPVR